MVKLKYKAMSANVFRFYRGTCHLFYEDLAAANALRASPVTWICGDLHIENFGSFKGNNRQVYFDLNDFDEAILAPAAWEVVRMVTSILIAFDGPGLKNNEAKKIAQLFLNSYSSTIKNGKAISIDPRTADGIVRAFLTSVEKRKQKELLKKRTQKKKGKLTLLLDADRHFEIDKSLKKELAEFINGFIETTKYSPFNFRVLDCVFRVAGTGSVGIKRYMFLLKSMNSKNKYLLLDMKQAMSSSLNLYVKIDQPKWNSEAERVIAIQTRMQNVSPALLNPVVFKDEPYVIKQLQPTEDKIDFELLKNRYDDINSVIIDMAVLAASAQLRSGGRQGSAITDEFIAYGQDNAPPGEFDKILKYALQYSKQVKKDYREFMAGYKKGMYQ